MPLQFKDALLMAVPEVWQRQFIQVHMLAQTDLLTLESFLETQSNFHDQHSILQSISTDKYWIKDDNNSSQENNQESEKEPRSRWGTAKCSSMYTN
jgi:hypothetical protein